MHRRARDRIVDGMIGAALLVSLAANAQLLKRPASTPVADTVAGRTIAASWQQALPGLRRPPADTEGTPVRLDACELRRTTLTAQIAELERVRQVRLPPLVRFAEGSANPSLTAAFASALGAQGDTKAIAHSAALVACHDDLCRLTLPTGTNPREWLARVGRSEWMAENFHEVARDGDSVLYAQHTPGALRSSDLLQQAVQDFEGSGAIEGCQAQFGGDGTLDAQVSLAPSEQEATSGDAAEIVAAGGLVGTSLGACIDAEFRKALRERTLPPHYEQAFLLAQFPRR
jgi:hypothetical protein